MVLIEIINQDNKDIHHPQHHKNINYLIKDK